MSASDKSHHWNGFYLLVAALVAAAAAIYGAWIQSHKVDFGSPSTATEPPSVEAKMATPQNRAFPALIGECAVEPKTAKIGEFVTFTASYEGGNDYYSFHWTGDDELNSFYPTISKRYTSVGRKKAVVEITSDNHTIACECWVLITR